MEHEHIQHGQNITRLSTRLMKRRQNVRKMVKHKCIRPAPRALLECVNSRRTLSCCSTSLKTPDTLRQHPLHPSLGLSGHKLYRKEKRSTPIIRPMAPAMLPGSRLLLAVGHIATTSSTPIARCLSGYKAVHAESQEPNISGCPREKRNTLFIRLLLAVGGAPGAREVHAGGGWARGKADALRPSTVPAWRRRRRTCASRGCSCRAQCA